MEDLYKTVTEIKDGIKHTTHYVNRPIQQGDPQGGSTGTLVEGVSTTTEIIKYVYMPTEELVTITKKEYDELKADSRMLSSLQGCGVDNWDGYDYAVEMFNDKSW